MDFKVDEDSSGSCSIRDSIKSLSSLLSKFVQKSFNFSNSQLLLLVSGGFFLALGLSACSLEASLTQIAKETLGVSDVSRTEPDVASGEEITVTTENANDYKIKVLVGEVSEQATTNNPDYQMEAVFNE